MAEPNPDLLQRRCPRLGGEVEFSYCRAAGEQGLPCFKVFDCWWEYFDVVGFYRNRLDREAFRRLAEARSTPKMASLLEMVEKAKRRLEE